jgi:hypothetical protein
MEQITVPNAFILSVTKCNDHPLVSPHTHVLAWSVGVTLYNKLKPSRAMSVREACGGGTGEV